MVEPSSRNLPGMHPIIAWLSWRRPVLYASLLALLVSLFSLATKGLHWGTEFRGETLLTIQLGKPVSLSAIQSILHNAGYAPTLLQYSGRALLVHLPPSAAWQSKRPFGRTIVHFIRRYVDETAQLRKETLIGPSIGSEFLSMANRLFLFSLVLLFGSLSIRFGWREATSILCSLLHDTLLSLGVLSLFSIEVDVTAVAALLTSMGYSLHHSILSLSALKENQPLEWLVDDVDLVNYSLTQQARRKILTTITTLLILWTFWFFKGTLLARLASLFSTSILFALVSSTYITTLYVHREPKSSLLRRP
eukprot:Blabericola_migrator_1__5396@NODE_2763_length_2380_cov_9_632080_g1729_i0_p1_GENE_NODE_2763_length_2380_cov_9_632080_g1729_i0NODE_2763_length_2380_cov_9_632080_g1729_i0_p1_ORF_typecomplete_len306_score6_15SecD_SecF/PF02355_16/4_7e03SecD_SecF/PF02355_16/1e27ACR_tran/PF00873_19/1_7e03ACR_tran/PF00873_19/0_0013HTH_33/PF13592_6/13HTH_33/PF13592_6/24DUF4481/PF14800_6/1_3e02DUF4481/PF14800_6/2_8e03DUF4481/PF14800_6/0_07_NODE_2763_length_2380_cov_9_632080_g1729_i03181235